MSSFVTAMDTTTAARVLGENGMPALETTGSEIINLFSALVRGADIAPAFVKTIKEAGNDATAMADLIVLAFQTRATRNAGKGEKALFYVLISLLESTVGAEAIEAVLPLVPHFGYWKDYLFILGTNPSARVESKIIQILVSKLQEDG